jgi:hypothetical protein
LASTLSSRISGGIRKIVIASGGPREGKSTVAAHLGGPSPVRETSRYFWWTRTGETRPSISCFTCRTPPVLARHSRSARRSRWTIPLPINWCRVIGQDKSAPRNGLAPRWSPRAGRNSRFCFAKEGLGFHWRQQPSAKEVAGLMAYLFPNGSGAVAQSERSKSATATRSPRSDSTIRRKRPFSQANCSRIKETDVKNLKVVTRVGAG